MILCTRGKDPQRNLNFATLDLLEVYSVYFQPLTAPLPLPNDRLLYVYRLNDTFSCSRSTQHCSDDRDCSAKRW